MHLRSDSTELAETVPIDIMHEVIIYNVNEYSLSSTRGQIIGICLHLHYSNTCLKGPLKKDQKWLSK